MNSNVPGIIITAGIIILVIGALIYSAKLQQKKKSQSWTGVVVDKDIDERVHQPSNMYGTQQRNNTSGLGIRIGGFGIGNANLNNNAVGITHEYSITVRPDVGPQFEWSVSSGFYEAVNIGDRVAKQSGTMLPEVIERAPAVAASQTVPQQPTQPQMQPQPQPVQPQIQAVPQQPAPQVQPQVPQPPIAPTSPTPPAPPTMVS